VIGGAIVGVTDAEAVGVTCAEDGVKWKQAAEEAAVALTARRALWDAVLEQVGHRAEPRPARALERLAIRVP
jgi:hypothetical protein